MKGFGWLLLIIGLIAVFAAFNMDVSVEISDGRRVNNIGLMSQQQNFILISCFIMLCGLLLVIFGRKNSIKSNSVKCPFCAELIINEAIKCKHCGSDLSKCAKNSMKPFHLSEMNPNLLTHYVGDNLVVRDDKLNEIVKEMIRCNPSKSGSEIAALYQSDIDSLAKSLPKKLREKFKSDWAHLINQI